MVVGRREKIRWQVLNQIATCFVTLAMLFERDFH